MPLLTAPACTVNSACPLATFPQSVTACQETPAVGGINDLYFIPCSSSLTEANLLDLDWWQGLIDDGTLGSMGAGLGSIAKKSDKKERMSSCSLEQTVQATWALKYQIKSIDKTSSRSTHAKINTLIASSSHFLVIARMCDGDNTVLPIGNFTTSDFNWTVPDNFEENQIFEFEVSWLELGIPVTYDVPGLSSVVPKAKVGLPAPGSSNS